MMARMRKENVMMADFAAPMAMASFAAPPIQIQVAQVVIKVFLHSYILLLQKTYFIKMFALS
jgi:hypothetical protein